MKTTTSTFSNEEENLLLMITAYYPERLEGKIKISITVESFNDDGSRKETLYIGDNLSEAIDIFNKNL